MVEKLLKEFDYLYGKDSDWRNYYNDLADFNLPRKAGINSPRLQGERIRFNFLYDSTALISLQTMAAGFHSNLTNPSSKWFAMSTRDPNLMDSYNVRMWCKNTQEKIFSTLNNSNFDTVMQEFYNDSGCFGMGGILSEEDWKHKIRFTNIPIEQITVTEDENGKVNRMFRSFKYTVQQAYSRWGDRAGKTVSEKIKDKPYDEIEVLHYVGPRDKTDQSKADSINMPWESIWINKTDKVEIERSGYLEFPYGVGRFYKDTNGPRGYSPAMMALAWTKLSNAQMQTVLRAAMKQADPALLLPSVGFVLPFNLNPAAANYYDPSVTNKDAFGTVPNGGNIPITVEVMQMTQQAIEKAFFVPLFRSISEITKQMTVPEVQRRIAESMVLLGPVVGRFTQEVITPIALERTFKILWRRGEIEAPPPEILENNAELDFVYLGQLAKAQRMSELNSITNFLTIASNVATVIPSTMDKIDGDKVIDVVAQVEGIDPEMLNSDEKVQGIRDQRQQQEAAQMQMAMLQQGGQIAKDASQAEKNMRQEPAGVK